MYEMYPDSWADESTRLEAARRSNPLRRRARKEHGTAPATGATRPSTDAEHVAA